MRHFVVAQISNKNGKSFLPFLCIKCYGAVSFRQEYLHPSGACRQYTWAQILSGSKDPGVSAPLFFKLYLNIKNVC